MRRDKYEDERGSGGNGGSSWISYSDMMASLMLVFVLMLCVSLLKYFTAPKEEDLQQYQSIQEQLKEIETREAALAEREAQLAKDLAELQKEKEQLEKDRAELQKAQEQLAKDQAELQKAQEQLKKDQEELQTAQEQLIKDQAELQKAQEQLTKDQEELQKAQEQLTKDQEALKKAQEQLTKGQEALKKAQEQLKKDQEELQKAQEQLKKDQEALKKAQEQLTKDQEALKKAQEQLEKEQAELQKAQEQLEKEQAELQTAQEQQTKDQAELQKEKEQLAKDQEALKKAQEQLEKDQAELQKAQEQLAKDQAALQAAQEQLKKDQQALEQERKELEELRAALEQEKKELEELRAALEQDRILLEEERTALETEKEQLKKDQAELKEGQDQLSLERETLRAAQEAFRAEQEAEATPTPVPESEWQQEIQQKIQKQQALLDQYSLRSRIIASQYSSFENSGLNISINQDTGDITTPNFVLFNAGRSALSDEGKQFLDTFIPLYLEVLMRPEYEGSISEITIEGYTDSLYFSAVELSQQRALQVMAYSLQIPSLTDAQRAFLSARASFIGRGFTDPVLDEHGQVDQEASRRVEIKFQIQENRLLSEPELIGELTSGLEAAEVPVSVDPETGDVLPDGILFFNAGEDTLTEEGKTFIRTFLPVYLDVLMKPDYQEQVDLLIIEGMTDHQVLDAERLDLSEQRAASVMEYCMQLDLTDAQRTYLQRTLTTAGRNITDFADWTSGRTNENAGRYVRFRFRLKNTDSLTELKELLHDN